MFLFFDRVVDYDYYHDLFIATFIKISLIIWGQSVYYVKEINRKNLKVSVNTSIEETDCFMGRVGSKYRVNF
jgi:hypothetical protein